MRWVSSDEIFSNVSFDANSGDISELQTGKYVACLYEDRCKLEQYESVVLKTIK